MGTGAASVTADVKVLTISQFNDDDRKKHASDAAKMMMGLLEQMGVDSSDEDEYDSCDNDILDDGS